MAFKVYDLAVLCCLIIAKQHLGKDIKVRSDGSIDEWQDGMLLCQNVLGYGNDFVLDRPAVSGHLLVFIPQALLWGMTPEARKWKTERTNQRRYRFRLARIAYDFSYRFSYRFLSLVQGPLDDGPRGAQNR